MHPTRRQVLEASIGVAGAATLSRLIPVARASSSEPTDPHRRFVFVYFLGGWDAIHCIDPKDPSVYDDSEATVQSTGVQTGIDALGLTPEESYRETDVEGLFLGHYVGDELLDLTSRMALIRGMTVTSVDHIAGAIHAMTGRAPAALQPRGSSLGTIFAAALGEEQLIPNLVSGLESYNLNHPNFASALEAVSYSDLMKILGPGLTALEPSSRDALETFFAKEEERLANPRMEGILGTRQSSQLLVQQQIAEVFNPANAANAAVVGAFTPEGGDLMERPFMAYQALTSGTSRCVSYRAHVFNDTHAGPDWRANHGYRLQSGFQSVAMLAELLQATAHPAGGSWLDHTTIVCASEFNRSPALNASGGRDHATTNSMAVLGAGIAGGRILGATHPLRMAGQAINLETGAVDTEAGTQVEHSHVGRTLLHSIGITDDIADFRVPHIPALLS